LTVDERDAEQMISGHDVSRASAAFQRHATAVRGEPKHPEVLRHDVALYAAVMDDRVSGKRAWFLTRDKTLSSASAEIHPGETPFCLNHLAFLQSISPFVDGPFEGFSFLDLYSSL